MIKNIFRKLPLKSLDDSFWLFVDKAEKEDIFRVNGKKMNLSRALNNQYKGPVLDYLLSEMAYLCQEFNGAAEITLIFTLFPDKGVIGKCCMRRMQKLRCGQAPIVS